MSELQERLRDAITASVADAEPSFDVLAAVQRRHRRQLRRRAAVTGVAVVVAAILAAFVAARQAQPGGHLPAAKTTKHPAAQLAVPRALHGVPLAGPTGLRLLVSADPPYVLNVDTGALTPVTGLNVKGNPVLSVLAVGADAVVWLDRRDAPGAIPRAEIYVIRHGTVTATQIATGWQVAPAAGGRAIWLVRYTDAHHCTLAELGLDGRARMPWRAISCSAQLLDTGSGTVLVRGHQVVDPATGRTLLTTGRLWAIAGGRALSSAGPGEPLTLTNLRTGQRWRLPWPSRIGGTDQAVVRPHGRLIALDFADAAYGEGGTQVTDAWLLDPVTRRFRHLPDMPAAVNLKFTSMAWYSDGRLVMLAQTNARGRPTNLIAVWKPGQQQIALRLVRLPARNNGSDTFLIW
ncbi:MAG: hypothetical protein ACTHKL_24395 [Streptosporangiaceae bacterium]